MLHQKFTWRCIRVHKPKGASLKRSGASLAGVSIMPGKHDYRLCKFAGTAFGKP